MGNRLVLFCVVLIFACVTAGCTKQITGGADAAPAPVITATEAPNPTDDPELTNDQGLTNDPVPTEEPMPTDKTESTDPTVPAVTSVPDGRWSYSCEIRF